MNKYLPVGTVIEWSANEHLVVTETKDNKPVCTGCFFSRRERRKKGLSDYSCYKHLMSCTAMGRKDRRHVIFKEV